MKRRHEPDELEDEPEVSIPRLEEEEERGETYILQDLQNNLQKNLKGDLNKTIQERLYETQKQYYTVYMEKLMHKVPMGKDLIKIISDNASDFNYVFTAAKTLIESQNRIRNIQTFHDVFDMVYNLMWRYIHEKVVSPTFVKVLSSKQLNLAYENYQQCSKTKEDNSVMEMQCLLYCIQEMLDSQEPVKIPNPLYSRFSQQMKAMSQYVITILVSLSKPVQEGDEPRIFEMKEGETAMMDEKMNFSETEDLSYESSVMQ